MREAGGRESDNFRNLGVGLRAGLEGTEKCRGNGEWEGGGIVLRFWAWENIRDVEGNEWMAECGEECEDGPVITAETWCDSVTGKNARCLFSLSLVRGAHLRLSPTPRSPQFPWASRPCSEPPQLPSSPLT